MLLGETEREVSASVTISKKSQVNDQVYLLKALNSFRKVILNVQRQPFLS